MATIYAHHKPNYRMGAWAYARRSEIREAIVQLQLEEALMSRIIADYAAKSCPACLGAGNVMKPIPGCECDGPRQHTCDLCKGTGETPSGVDASVPPHACRWFNGRCIDCGRAYGEPRNAGVGGNDGR